MGDISKLIAQANARGPTSGFTDVADEDDVELPPDVERAQAKIFSPLRVGDLTLQHRVIHAALGRSRSANSMESPLAAKYFSQRTTPGSLIISQATTIGAEWAAWPWGAGLDTPEQQQAVYRTIRAVHEKSGYWFQQLFHVGRCTSPALVKLARNRAGLQNPPPYSYRGVSASAVAESGINTHSGEPFGEPHPLTVEELHRIRDDYKRTAQRSVDAGADGIEVLAGNGFLLDQFLHDNINQRTDEYGGSVENRSRFVLEVVDAVAEVVGYQRIGVRVSPFSNFHETDGSQPLEQVLHLSRHLALRGIAYLHVGEGRVSRNLDVEANLKRLLDKGISHDDISLRPFRRLLSKTLSENPTFTPTVLVGNGGYTAVPGILTVEQGLADAVSFGRRFISNQDLVERLQFGYPLTPYDRSTFYTHGAEGYTTYPTYRSTQVRVSEATDISTSAPERTPLCYPLQDSRKKRVAVIGAGISGIVSAAALQRVGGFDIQLYERRGEPGGSWVYDSIPTTVPQFPATDDAVINPPVPEPEGSLPLTVPRSTQERFHATALYSNLQANIPGTEVSAAVSLKAHQFDHYIQYHTTVEDVEKLLNGKLRLVLRHENLDDTDTWSEEVFDHLIVATGHNSVPKVPDIPGLSRWSRNLRHTVTWRSGEEFRNQKIFIVGTSESAIDVCLQSLPYARGTVYVSQRTPHPRYPTVFCRPGVEVVATISHFTEDTIYLTDGTVLTDIDTVVFATGYFYTYPFLSSKIRPPPVAGYRVPGLYQHIFDIYNPDTIAFVGVANASLSWLTWEKSAFLIGLLWSGKIRLPAKAQQEEWETRRLAETGDRLFHILARPWERVIYWDELNELAADYLHTDATDDTLLRSFPFEWVLELMKSGEIKANFYRITDKIPGSGSIGPQLVNG
ncbi:hypothetical protein N7449_003479 [Penicillium cf. viridicatum]|uniref:NADH:flavin oxidoreductase/NADH oxidase N-terminal domain-containing protein n=1 Tax=Penicillium cf. viridicatum TaxID=2972119 RepID=A0A9W9MXI5_9EURO|nr:hypothetical protein N7449_003479 [Penicillium cf. viridicatum]